MANQTGIAITIKAWLPTGKTLDEQYAALTIVKAAHETGDYAALLTASKIEAVQTEQKTRRFEDQPQQPAGEQPQGEQQQEPAGDAGPNDPPQQLVGDDNDEHPLTAAINKDKRNKAA